MVPLSFPLLSARAGFGVYTARGGEGTSGYLVIEQCLADGFRGSRCGRRWREWGRLVGHCVMAWLRKLLAAAIKVLRCGAHGIVFPNEGCCRRVRKSCSSCDAKSGFRNGSTFGAGSRKIPRRTFLLIMSRYLPFHMRSRTSQLVTSMTSVSL